MSGRSVVMVAVGGPRRASSRLRVHAWEPYLRARGVETRIFALHPDPGTAPPPSGLLGPLRRRSARIDEALRSRPFWTGVIEAARGANGVFLQETVPPKWATDALRREVGHLVFDFSDPIHVTDGPGQGMAQWIWHRAVTEPRLAHLLERADSVMLENDRIREYAGRGGARVEVVRGPMDVDFYRPARERDDPDPRGDGIPVIGWTGSNGTLRFLEPLVPVLRRVAESRPFRLHTVGLTKAPDFPGLEVVNTPWEKEAEARAVAGFDIALAWLPDTPWTRLRGGAKLIVYMAAGVPVVTSPGGIGDQVVTPGEQGFLASSEREWQAHLETLLDDAVLRRRMGRIARETAVARHGYQANLPLMEELLGVG